MLWRKLWRDIKGNFGAYLAVISVIIIGLMMYVAFSITFENLSRSLANYYQDYRFGDVFSQVVSAPRSLESDLARVQGVDRVSGRIVRDVLVYRTSGQDTTTMRLVSFVPKQGVNRFILETGRLPRENQREILVSQKFLAGNKYALGTNIPLIIQGRKIDFTITGTATSPEFVYEIPNGQTMAPNPKAFGVAYVPYSVSANIFNMQGKVNDISFTLDPQVSFESVKSKITSLLKPYGLIQLYPRKLQLSDTILMQEIKSLKGTATTTPVIFLGVAAATLYIMLRRMVEQQRGQIGLLKAFGYGDWQIIAHYLSYGVIIGFVGGLGGGLAGSGLTYSLAVLYRDYFDIPNFGGSFSIGYIMSSTLIAVVFSIFAGFQGAKQVLTLTPISAMHPPAPTFGRKIFLEKLVVFWRQLNTQWVMALRNIFRNRQRSFFALFGVAFAFAMMVASGASFDSTDFMMDFQFNKQEKYDLKVTLEHPIDIMTAREAGKSLQGVTRAEPLLEVPVTMSHKWYEKDVVISGLPQDARLYRLLTKENKSFSLPKHGLVISEQLAKILHLAEGDMVTIKTFSGERKEQSLRVETIVPQYVGLGAYMDIAALSKVITSPPAASSILLQAEESQVADIRKDLQEGSNVLNITDKTRDKKQFEELLATSRSTQYILLLFAFITGFAIVYNITLISLSERERELATLLVIGMTEGEVARILIYEQSLLGLVGAIIGIPLSYGMMYGIISGTASDIYNLPVIISEQSLTMGLAGTVLFLIAAQWKIVAKIKKLPMLDVLKQQE